MSANRQGHGPLEKLGLSDFLRLALSDNGCNNCTHSDDGVHCKHPTVPEKERKIAYEICSLWEEKGRGEI